MPREKNLKKVAFAKVKRINFLQAFTAKKTLISNDFTPIFVKRPKRLCGKKTKHF
jgi:hypothetical protein